MVWLLISPGPLGKLLIPVSQGTIFFQVLLSAGLQVALFGWRHPLKSGQQGDAELLPSSFGFGWGFQRWQLLFVYVWFPSLWISSVSVFPALTGHSSSNCGNERTWSCVNRRGGRSQNIWQQQKKKKAFWIWDREDLIKIKHVINLKCFWKYVRHASCVMQLFCNLGAEHTAGVSLVACIAMNSAHEHCLKHPGSHCRLL